MKTIEEIKKTWRGAYIPLLTIYNEDLTLDLEAIKGNVRFLLDKGAKAGNTVLLVVGAGGDFPVLTIEERKQVSEAVVEEVQKKIPVIIGAQHTSTHVILDLAKHAEDIGADGIQMSPTYYYRPSHEDVYELFKMVNDSVKDLTISIYNTHWENDYNMSLELIDRLAALENVLALKWGTPLLNQYLKGYQLFADRLAICDNFGLKIMNHMLGGVGMITHAASFWPEHEWTLWQWMEEGQYKKAQDEFMKFNMEWKEFRSKMEKRSGGEGNAVKLAMEAVGLAGGPSRLPTRTHAKTDEDRKYIKEFIERSKERFKEEYGIE